MNECLKAVEQVKPKPKQRTSTLCQGCSYQHYDIEGGTYCGLAEYAEECPRGGGRF